MLHYLTVCWFYNLISLCFGSHTAQKHTTGTLCKPALNKVSGMRYVGDSPTGWLIVTETLRDERGKANTRAMHKPNKWSMPEAVKDNKHDFDLRASNPPPTHSTKEPAHAAADQDRKPPPVYSVQTL